MAPGFTLKSLSPSRSALPTLPALPLPSPSHDGSGAPRPNSWDGSGHPQTSPASAFSASRAKTSKEETLKTVRALEEVLNAWNEYRVALHATGRAGKKFAGALKELGARADRGDLDVPSKAIGPAAGALESVADLTTKLAKRIEREYEGVNGEASKYFSLLAKESRNHEAYLGAVGKKHDKAEKAYKKASKALADTSAAHAGLWELKQGLAEDMARAHDDHVAHLGAKQDALLFRLASSTGTLSANTLSFFSDGLRSTASTHPEIEYYRTLSEAQWRGRLPSSFQQVEEEERRREEVRLLKSRVTTGEADIVGPYTWDALSPSPSSSEARQSLPSTALSEQRYGHPLRSAGSRPSLPSYRSVSYDSSRILRTGAGAGAGATATATAVPMVRDSGNVSRRLPLPRPPLLTHASTSYPSWTSNSNLSASTVLHLEHRSADKQLQLRSLVDLSSHSSDSGLEMRPGGLALATDQLGWEGQTFAATADDSIPREGAADEQTRHAGRASLRSTYTPPMDPRTRPSLLPEPLVSIGHHRLPAEMASGKPTPSARRVTMPPVLSAPAHTPLAQPLAQAQDQENTSATTPKDSGSPSQAISSPQPRRAVGGMSPELREYE